MYTSGIVVMLISPFCFFLSLRQDEGGALVHEHAQGGPSRFRDMLYCSPAPQLLRPEYAGQFHWYIRHHCPVLVEELMKVE